MSTAPNPEDTGDAGDDVVVVGERGLTADIARAVAEHDEALRAAMQRHMQRKD